MKRTPYILLSLLFFSCAGQKNISSSDQTVEVYHQAFKEAKDRFLASDSAVSVMQELGWVQKLVSEAKIQDNSIPAVFKSINNGDGFTVEMPCWEFDTFEYHTSNVIVEHANLDTALVNAKLQGVDDIFLSSNQNIIGCRDSVNHSFHTEKVIYLEEYADYISNARFSCVCITKTKNKYIVNATIVVPRTN